LRLMAAGLTNRQIARRLSLSEHTVKFHATSLLGKLRSHSRAEAVARAISLGWLPV
jgi:DNA-binding NarL/FixJ family response regulator